MRKAFVLLAFLFLSVNVFTQPFIGKKAQEITLPGLQENKIKLSSLKGKVVLIDFWASWCGPCRMNNPELKTLYEKYKSKGFEIYGVSLDSDKTEWKTALTEDQINWIQVIDTSGKVAVKWKISYIPNTFLLDTTGKIIAVNPSHDELEMFLKKLVG